MSAPKTNIERQTTRHRPSLTGIAIAAFAVLAITAGVVIWSSPDRSEQAAPGSEAATTQ